MMPETVGQQIKKARQERGLSLEQVARVLHIRVDYLLALEEDKRKLLPSPVHARGFLRMYADHLGMAAQPLLDQWDGKFPLPQIEIGKTEQASTEVLEEPAVNNSEIDQPQVVEFSENEEPTAEIEQQTEDDLEEDFVEEDAIEDEPIPSSPSRLTASRSAFNEIGDRLRKQRLALNLSIPEIERYIHVRQHYLNALEDGRIGDLPSPVQGRGMLSNYAHFLNLDVDSMLLLFAEGLQSRREERLPPSLTQKKEDPRSPKAKKAPRRLLSMDLLVSIVLVMIILGFALWTAAQVDSLNSDRSGTTTPPSIADVLLSNPTITPRPSATPTLLANLSTLVPGEVGSRPSANTPDVNATIPVSGDFPLQVYVVALQRAYLRITVDNKVVFDGRVVPGNAYPFTGNEKIELLTGSAAAIQVFFNQQDLGVLGLVGQVKSYIFSSDGAVTPTPMFTATPTRTTQPTSTSQPSPTAPTSTITPFVP
jgi:cytoskeleton protein RodZ